MSKRYRRKSFTPKERIAFAEDHGRVCAICRNSGLMTELEIRDELIKEGKYVFTFPDGSELISTAYFRDPLMIEKVANIDHKTPLSRGGTNDLDNLQLLCRSCNLSKGNLTMEEFKSKLTEESMSNEK